MDIIIGILTLVIIIAIVKYGGEGLNYALNSFKERGAEVLELSGIVVDYKTKRVFESTGNNKKWITELHLHSYDFKKIIQMN